MDESCTTRKFGRASDSNQHPMSMGAEVEEVEVEE